MTAEEKRRANRERMPGVAAMMDELEAVFGKGQVKVRWASENGIELGKRVEILE